MELSGKDLKAMNTLVREETFKNVFVSLGDYCNRKLFVIRAAMDPFNGDILIWRGLGVRKAKSKS